MSNIAKRFKRRGDLEGALQDMFDTGDNRTDAYLFVNDFTEEGVGTDNDRWTPLALFYVRKPDGDQHVGTWNKKTRKGWIFQRACDLIKEEVA